MQCSRCASVVADTATVCPACGNLLGGGVDSYGVTSFAPVLPSPQPAAHVSVRHTDLATANTMFSTAAPPVPPTMVSNAPNAPPRAVITPAPQYVVSPTRPSREAPASPQPHMPTMSSAMPPPTPMSPIGGPNSPMPMSPYGPMQPYGPPPMLGMTPQSYPMMMQQPPQAQQGTPGLAVAALVCGLLGWIPLWIGFILCLLAITFSSIVLASTQQGRPGRGLAITGLVCGLVLLLPAACGL